MFIPHYVSYVMCHMSRVTCHVSPVTCHLWPITIFFFRKKFEKVVELVCGGSVITGPTLSRLYKIDLNFYAVKLFPQWFPTWSKEVIRDAKAHNHARLKFVPYFMLFFFRTWVMSLFCAFCGPFLAHCGTLHYLIAFCGSLRPFIRLVKNYLLL